MVFIRPQGHEGHHPYKQLLLTASCKAFVTKQSAQLSTALTVTQHRAVHFHLPQIQVAELSGNTFSVSCAVQHQSGPRRPDPA